MISDAELARVHPALLSLGRLLEEPRDMLRERQLPEAEHARLCAYIRGVLDAAKVVAIHLSTEEKP